MKLLTRSELLEEIDIAYDEKRDAEATAARRLDLLRRGLEPLNSAEYRIWVEDVKKELADD